MEPPAGDEFISGPEELIARLRRYGISDERVLQALLMVPRTEFLTPEQQGRAYWNEALPIEAGQSISQPYVVAMMTSALQLRGSEKVLDLGTGSGYQAAILSLLAGTVIGVERHPILVAQARQRLARLGYHNVTVHQAEEQLGWPHDAPYDAILCAAAAPHLPASLLAQLAPTPEARLVLPVGDRREQRLLLVHHTAEQVVADDLGPVHFVPLIGPGAWSN